MACLFFVVFFIMPLLVHLLLPVLKYPCNTWLENFHYYNIDILLTTYSIFALQLLRKKGIFHGFEYHIVPFLEYLMCIVSGRESTDI